MKHQRWTRTWWFVAGVRIEKVERTGKSELAVLAKEQDEAVIPASWLSEVAAALCP